MAEIPTFECKSGCHGCCGVVPFTTTERDRVAAIRPLEQWEPFVNGSWVPTGALQTMTCPFLTKEGCGIYDVRPIVCQLFGAVDHPMMKCPMGCGPEHKLSEKQSRELIARAS